MMRTLALGYSKRCGPRLASQGDSSCRPLLKKETEWTVNFTTVDSAT